MSAFSGTNLTYSSVDGVKYLFSDSYAFLIDGSSASGDLSLPSNVDSKPVRLIADSAFSEQQPDEHHHPRQRHQHRD